MSLPGVDPLPSPSAGPEPPRPRRPRREKPRIELAPGQPLTSQGRPRARVYVACLQCRTRKIRCDGAKPTCHNCTRRTKPTDPCTYDAVPKRRGPDKTPGARQRTTREARQQSDSDDTPSRRRRRQAYDPTSPPQPHIRPAPPPKQLSLVLDPQLVDMPPFQSAPSSSQHPLPPGASFAPSASLVSDPPPAYRITTSRQALHDSLTFRPQLDPLPPLNSLVTPTSTRLFNPSRCSHDSDSYNHAPDIPSEPSLDFVRQTWWESLLTTYYLSLPPLSVPMSRRQQAANQITTDLRFLFRSSNYWLSFINIPRFFSIYFDPERRLRMQPSLLPAALAIATFFQSSEAGSGKEGRKKAMCLRNVAQGALEASLNARWIDEELAQAAWLLALFEVCAHPDHTSERTVSGLVTLDTIIRALSLTFIDMEHPACTSFSPRSVPSVASASRSWAVHSSLNAGIDNSYSTYVWKGCSCASRTLGQCWAAAHEYAPLWVSSPAWDGSWSDAEIRKETCRRLCWSTLLLTAGHTSYVTATNQTPPDLFVLEPANFALLFPGETMRSSAGDSGKDTIWSLNYRTMLLWHSCLRIRHDPSVSEAERAHFGFDAWREADALEKALDSHTCDLERTFLYQGREYLFNVRSLVMHEFRRYAPLANGDAGSVFYEKARDWLTHQANVAHRVVQSLAAVTGHASHTLTHRPFFAFWFMSQISRALSLWECDKLLTLALDVGTTLFEPVDYLSALWPCPEQRRRSQIIRGQLAAACRDAGRPLPPPSALGALCNS